MARTTAPLLSLSASGKLADTLVASVWKGIPVMRHYVRPANPRTAAQVAQRDAMADVVAAWRNYFTDTGMRSAWNRLALLLADTMSGFNAFVKNSVKVVTGDPDASFAFDCAAIAGKKAEWNLKNLDDGAAGDEADNFEIWAGDEPGSLLLSESVAIAAGKVTGTAALGATADVKYVKIRKGGYDRSGVSQITLAE